MTDGRYPVRSNYYGDETHSRRRYVDDSPRARATYGHEEYSSDDFRQDSRYEEREYERASGGSYYSKQYADEEYYGYASDESNDDGYGRRTESRKYDYDDLDDEEPVGTRIGRRAARHRDKRKKGKDRRQSSVAFVMVIVVFAVLGLVGWWGFDKIMGIFSTPDYEGNGKGEVLVEVHKGDTITQIGASMAEKDVVKSAEAFTEAAAEVPEVASVQPGTYKMRKQMSGASAVNLMLDPASKVSRTFTVPEGKSTIGTLEIISKKGGFSLDELKEAASDPAGLGVPSWGRNNVEGFLYPDTYQLEPKATPKDALKMMVDRSKQVFTEINLETRAAQMGKDPYDLLIIASLVEMEAGIESDFGKIARVAFNRLDHVPNFLNFDSTTQYWLELTGKGRKHLLTNNELRDPENNYSTTVNKGLPPTAISSPGKKAVEAAIDPPPGDWMYFVAIDENGRSEFAVTQEEHNANVEICRQKNLGC